MDEAVSSDPFTNGPARPHSVLLLTILARYLIDFMGDYMSTILTHTSAPVQQKPLGVLSLSFIKVIGLAVILTAVASMGTKHTIDVAHLANGSAIADAFAPPSYLLGP